jgi:hypothetical protein
MKHMADRSTPLYGAGITVLIKYCTSEYPRQVHTALAAKGLTPALRGCRVLPGGLTQVTCYMLHVQAQQPAVRAAGLSPASPTAHSMCIWLYSTVAFTGMQYH